MKWTTLQVLLIAFAAAYVSERCLFTTSFLAWLRQGGGKWPGPGCVG